jgi:hypothetical protein
LQIFSNLVANDYKSHVVVNWLVTFWLISTSVTTYIVWLVEVTCPWNSYDYHIVLVQFQIFSKCKELGSMPPSFPYFSPFWNIIINLKVYSQYLKTNLKAWQVPMLANVFVFFHNIKGGKLGEGEVFIGMIFFLVWHRGSNNSILIFFETQLHYHIIV